MYSENVGQPFLFLQMIEPYMFADVLPLVYNALESEHAIVCTSALRDLFFA